MYNITILHFELYEEIGIYKYIYQLYPVNIFLGSCESVINLENYI
jgi:hypothetical protein